MIVPQLDTPISRPESINQIISDMSFQRGISSFFIDNIPFSWSTGNAFADIVFQYVKLLIQQQKNDAITHCYEIGAGIGQLSQKILQRLQNEKKLNKVKWHISDAEDSIVERFKHSPINSLGFTPT